MIPLLPDTGSVETNWAVFIVILAGILGALVRDILDGEGLLLPNITNGKLFLGFVGEMFVGGVAGYFLGDSALGSFAIGLTAAAFVNRLITKPLLK